MGLDIFLFLEKRFLIWYIPDKLGLMILYEVVKTKQAFR